MRAKLKKKIVRINRTLFELETGIFLFGLFCQMFVFFVKDKAGYSLGLWLGIFAAGAGAVHMWWTLDRALELEERLAVRKMSTHNILRYLAVAVVLVLVCISHIANPLSTFLGIMGLKASAYLQFLTRKLSTGIYGEEILPPLIEEDPAGEQET